MYPTMWPWAGQHHITMRIIVASFQTKCPFGLTFWVFRSEQKLSSSCTQKHTLDRFICSGKLITWSADAHQNSGRDELSMRSINNTAPLQCCSDRLPPALQCLKYLKRLTSNEYINFNCAHISSRSVQAARSRKGHCFPLHLGESV